LHLYFTGDLSSLIKSLKETPFNGIN